MRKIILLAIILAFIIVSIILGCGKTKEERAEGYKNMPKHSVKVKYGDDPWIKYDNVIQIKTPDRYDTRTVLDLDDGSRLSIVGGIIVWTDNIPVR